MESTRRNFLGCLAAALVLDPERALWVPGKKLISIPKPKPPLADGQVLLISYQDAAGYVYQESYLAWGNIPILHPPPNPSRLVRILVKPVILDLKKGTP